VLFVRAWPRPDRCLGRPSARAARRIPPATPASPAQPLPDQLELALGPSKRLFSPRGPCASSALPPSARGASLPAACRRRPGFQLALGGSAARGWIAAPVPRGRATWHRTRRSWSSRFAPATSISDRTAPPRPPRLELRAHDLRSVRVSVSFARGQSSSSSARGPTGCVFRRARPDPCAAPRQLSPRLRSAGWSGASSPPAFDASARAASFLRARPPPR